MDDHFSRPPGAAALDPDSASMVAAAAELITERYAPDRHSVAAAVRDAEGRLYLAVNLDAYVGRAAICAEAIAVGQAITAGAAEITAVAAVRHPRPEAEDQRLHVVSPCGLCRELLLDYAPNATGLAPTPAGELVAMPVRDLMPERFERHDKPRPA